MSQPKSVPTPPAVGFFRVDYGCGMYYYQFNIGDYQSHTGHLEPLEDCAYRRMLDWCYLHERPLPDDIDQIAKLIRMRSHNDCIANVLQEFFVRTADGQGWWQERIGKEIAKTAAKSEKAAQSAKARWGKEKTDANALPPQSERNATHNPLPITHNPLNKEANASLSGTTFPPCPHQDILKLWSKRLPHLAQPRVWEGTRQAWLRQRWVQAAKPSAFSPNGYKTTQEGLAWWDAFFAYIADDTSLSKGFESQGRVWRPDLEWVVNASNFAKIIDGKYAK